MPKIFLNNHVGVDFLFLFDIAIALFELRFHLLGHIFNVYHESDIETEDILKAWGQESDS